MVTVLGTGPPPQPPTDLSVDLLRCRVRSLPAQSRPQHPLAYLIELQGEPQPLGSRIRP